MSEPEEDGPDGCILLPEIEDVLGENYSDSPQSSSGFNPDEDSNTSNSKSPEFDTHRNFNKLHFDLKMSHDKRREHTLQWQKRRRDELIDKVRQLEYDSFSEDEEVDESMDFVKTVEQRQNEAREWTGRKTKTTGRRWNGPAKVMLSEWLEEKPDDFEENWLGVLCPVGLRCLVVSTRGRTRIVTRRGFRIGEYQSSLPGGRKYRCREDSKNSRPRGVTILDCIWSEQSQTFYVLDLLCWNSTLCTDCDTEYRQFFLKSKIEEYPEILEKTESNPFPFIPLPFFAIDELPTVMTMGHQNFPENIDGVLFFHKESFYIYATNPCCLWLHLSQVPTRLNIEVSPDLLAKEQPPKVPYKKKVKGSQKMEMK